MSSVQEADVAQPVSTDEALSAKTTRLTSVAAKLSFRNIGAVYVWILIIVLFAIASPHVFASFTTAKSILNQYAITGMAALSLVVPLAAGFYDLSIGSTLGFAGILAAWLLQHYGWMSPIEAALVTMVVCVVIGLVNAVIVVFLKVDSFIGTLASGGILSALTVAISGDQPIAGRIAGSFSKLGIVNLGGVDLPVFYMLVLMVIIGYVLERTQVGRRVYASGYDRETARMTGIRVNAVAVSAFVSSAALAGFAGLCLAATIGSGTPDSGTSYLIPAFSAAFLGATQFRRGRFNPWGVVIAVLLLGTGDVGLLIIRGPVWAPQFFEGAVLIAAVALTKTSFGASFRSRLRRAQ
jgi:ribose transport system permease protein